MAADPLNKCTVKDKCMSYQGIFDTHAHYDDSRFDGEREKLLESLEQKGVSLVVNCGSDLASSQRSLALAEKYSFIYAAVGIHPHECGDAPHDWEKILRKLMGHPKAVAIGEIGLDYHYDFSPRELQKQFFERQLQLAQELSVPVVVHDREAHEDTFNILSRHSVRAVLHCYSGSAEQAVQYAKMGMYMGFGGSVTFKNAKKPIESAAAIPLDKLLLETDCPYMAPVPHRGELCTSDMIAFSAEKIAAAREMDAQVLIDKARINGMKFFGIK